MAIGKRERVPDMDARRVWGVVLLPLSLFLALGLFSYDWKDISLLATPPNQPPNNLIGPVGAWLSFALFLTLGIGAYLVPLWSFVFGGLLLFSGERRLWARFLWGWLLLLSLVSLVQLHAERWTATCESLNVVDPGGLISHAVTTAFLVRWLSRVGTGIVIWVLLLGALCMLAGIPNIRRLYRWLCRHGLLAYEKARLYWMERRAAGRKMLSAAGRSSSAGAVARPGRNREAPVRPPPAPALESRDGSNSAPNADVSRPSPRAERGTRKRPAAKPASRSPETELQYRLPPVDLLQSIPSPGTRGLKTDTETTARILVETLAEFGIEGEVTNVERGPVVTRYELLPAPGVRVERISGLSNNLALTLKATSVRVQAPIPGKGVVGIEVPNSTANSVCLRDVLEGDAWQSGTARLPLVLGKDVGGNDLVADLADMPHLLIAGATGAGKTVCMNSVLAGLLMSRTPEQLRLLLVDPKIVEFSVYNHLPHLVVPVVTNPRKVALGLRWAINEMENRYKLFARVGVRNIESYNRREIARQESLFEDMPGEPENADQPPARLPYIVIVIDELADLMLADGAEIENCVARLAQLSRAVGIHMILSTQRPSVNVITGTIKANFPARIAFQVAQKVDSRTILDTTGADKLLGRGDMLFLPPGTSKLVRAQGAMTTDEEIHRIVDFIKQQAEPAYEEEIRDKIEKSTGKLEGSEDDDLLGQAIDIIRETQRASTSSLQRRLRIGYTRAARLIDILEERGIVGPPRGSDPREILVDLDNEIPNNPETRVPDADGDD